jgi:FolB domain-containing protein
MDIKEQFAKFDKIRINDLQLRCIIGINDWERTQKQDVLINIILYTDLSKPGKTDDIADAVDYKKVKSEIIEMVDKSSFNLIERLADEIARICLAHNAIKAVCVKVDKPAALRFAKSVGVEILRTQT